MSIQKVAFPKKSLLSDINYDYSDSYSGNIQIDSSSITSKKIGEAFFLSAPDWIGSLLNIRNRIVSIFGLKTGKNFHKNNNDIQFEKGEQLGMFRVYDTNEDELILGEDDQHLNFRVSLLIENNTESKPNITISTIVIFNNWLGRLYFLPVKPFHKLIVKSMLKNTIRELELKDAK